MSRLILEIVECPECTAPAEIADRFVLESTDGPIEHAIVVCLQRHRFTMLVERLATPSTSTIQAVDDTLPRSGEGSARRHP